MLVQAFKLVKINSKLVFGRIRYTWLIFGTIYFRGIDSDIHFVERIT